MSQPMLGAKVRALRRMEGLSQVELARQLEISASYLNLIEHNRRPLTAPLLIKLAQLFDLDLSTFADDDERRLADDLHEVFGDPMFEEHGLGPKDARELASGLPEVARAVRTLYQTWRETRESARDLAARVSDGQELADIERVRLPSEEVSDFIQRHNNHFPALEALAETLREEAGLEQPTLFAGLVSYLTSRHGVTVKLVPWNETRRVLRRFDRGAAALHLSEVLPPGSRIFQAACQVALMEHREVLDGLVDDRLLSTAESRNLARVVLANYFAGAVLMPYAAFRLAARELRHDIEILSDRFGASFEQVCHRMTTLRRPGDEGIPFHMIRVDIAGNISKRFTASGIRFPRFGSGCPRWDVYQALVTPGQLRVQISEATDGARYFCVAKGIRKGHGGYQATHTMHAIGLGCRLEHARELVYGDGMDLSSPEGVVPIGTSCRLCDRLDCEQRAFPSIQHPLRVDQDVRGISPFSPAVG